MKSDWIQRQAMLAASVPADRIQGALRGVTTDPCLSFPLQPYTHLNLSRSWGLDPFTVFVDLGQQQP